MKLQMNRYFADKLNYSRIDKNTKHINGCSMSKHLKRDLNQKIDLDFVKESDFIENINNIKPVNPEDSINISELLEHPKTKILRSFPYFDYDIESKNLSYEEKQEKTKDYIINTTLLLQNLEKLSDFVEIKNSGHLYALNLALKEARHARNSEMENKKGSKECPLTHDLIMQLNEALFINTPQEDSPGIGRYRSQYSNQIIRVSDSNTPREDGAFVSQKMDELLDWYNNKSKDLHPIERAAIFHIEFLRIHPFVDGNGRTARLLLNYEFVRRGYPTITIKSMQKQEYFDALESAYETNDCTKLVKIMAKSMLNRQEQYLELINSVKRFKRGNKSDDFVM